MFVISGTLKTKSISVIQYWIYETVGSSFVDGHYPEEPDIISAKIHLYYTTLKCCNNYGKLNNLYDALQNQGIEKCVTVSDKSSLEMMTEGYWHRPPYST